MKAWDLRRLALSAVLTATLAACGVDHRNESGQALKIGISVAPNSFMPILAVDTTENMLNHLIFDGLTSVDENGNDVPILAREVPSLTNGGISRDGKTITFRLRRDVRWQDGVPFTSRDVAFTFHAIMDPHNNVSSHAGFEQVTRVETPSPDRVVFHLRAPYAPAVEALFGESDAPQVIIPEHILAKEPDLNMSSFNDHPIGTGPFKLVNWTRGERIDFVANPKYFRGKPKLAHIVVKLIPDENTEFIHLTTGEIDWFFEPTPNLYPQLRTVHGITVRLVQTNQFAGMLINMEKPLLRELAVRQAILAAIDKAALVQNYTHGSAVIADQDLPPWLWASPKSAVAPSSLDLAKHKLAAAGFTPGADGVQTRAGERLAFLLSYAEGSATNRLVAVALQARLRSIGIETTIKSYQAARLFAPAGMGGILARGSYDLNLSGWVSGVDPDNSTQFTCSSRPPSGSNESRLCDPAMDAAQRLALSSYDRQTRKAAYAKIEQILKTDIPEIFFYYPRGIQAYSSSFAGFTPNSVTESWNAFQWTISSPTTRQ